MKIVAEVLLILSVGILPFLLSSLQFAKNRETYIRLTNIERLINTWIATLASISAVVYIALNQPGGTSSIGLPTGNASAYSSAAMWGMLAMLVILVPSMIFSWVGKRKKPQEQILLDETRPEVENIARYKKFWERASYLTVLVFVVICEDLVSRGYLVLLLGTRTHTFIPWILISIAVSVIAHLYQGNQIKTILWQILFACLFIGVTLATKNLWAAIAPHLLYDIVWTAKVWKMLDEQNHEQAKHSYSKMEKIFFSFFLSVNGIFFWWCFFIWY